MTVDLQVQNLHTGEVRTIAVSEQLADRILHSPEPPATGNWVPLR